MGSACPMDASRQFGRYTLPEQLGDGPLGSVYRALDCDPDRPVVVRILGDRIKWDPNVRERFYSACRNAAALRHENIASVLEVGDLDESPFLATEYLGCGDLRSLMSRRPALSVEKKLSVMMQVADGLDHAHANGVLHLDLKPSKIHVTPEGGIKVRDFGLAQALMRHLIQPGVRWGVPIYLSPEQIQRQECDGRSDIFSAGVVFHELIAGVHPFHDQNSNKSIDKILFETELPGGDEHPGVPPAVWAIIRKCLAKDLDERYQSAAEVSGACRELLKDIAEDSQMMMAELQAALPRLRRRVERPGAPAELAAFLQDVQNVLACEEAADFAALDRLMEVLADHYLEITGTGRPDALEILPRLIVPADAALPPSNAEAALQLFDPVRDQSEVPLPAPPAEAEQVSAPAIAIEGIPEDASVTSSARASDVEPLEAAAADAENGLKTAEAPSAPAESQLPEAGGAGRQADPSHWAFSDVAAAAAQEVQERADPEVPAEVRPPRTFSYHTIRQPAFRTAAALLSVLLIVVAWYIAKGRGDLASARAPWSAQARGPAESAATPGESSPIFAATAAAEGRADVDAQQQGSADTISVLFREAQGLAAAQRPEESRVLIRRILELDPAHEPAIAALRQLDSRGAATAQASGQLQQGVALVSALIDAGKLKPAKSELDKLQASYPAAPEVTALRKRWEARNSRLAQDQLRKEEEQRAAPRLRRGEEFGRRVEEIFSQGNYSEARGALQLWLAEDSANTRAQELGRLIDDAQRGMKEYEAALSASRYTDALAALSTVERANPADPNLAALRGSAEARRAAARATLTIHRLGRSAVLLLDGRPVGSNGEVEREVVSVGNHTLAFQDERGLQTSVNQEFADGQRLVFVYDTSRQLLRPMAEGDREMMARTKAMEEVHRFSLEHDHRLFLGNCRGELLLSYSEVEFRPDSGSHGFRVPLRRLNIAVAGRSIDFTYASDGKELITLRAIDAREADRLRQTWDRLRALER